MESQQHGWSLPTGTLKPALELALAVTHGDMGVLMLHDEAQGTLLPVLGVGLDDEQCAAIGTHRPGVGPIDSDIAASRSCPCSPTTTRSAPSPSCFAADAALTDAGTSSLTAVHSSW
jgi:hypothetical protein